MNYNNDDTVKIYTRKGDDGQTSLFGGARVSKDHVRVEAYGSVDELNSALGFAIAMLPPALGDWRDQLVAVQSDCFAIGAILAAPKSGAAKPEHIPDLPESRVVTLEREIDELDEEIEPLRSFVLPGGIGPSASLQLARSVCRRAERRVVTLAELEEVDPIVIKYLNRLSDFLFTLARAVNARMGVPDVEWHPTSET